MRGLTGKGLSYFALVLTLVLVLGRPIVNMRLTNDFLQFYTYGWLVLHHQSQILYNTAARLPIAAQFAVPGKDYAPPLTYGPQVALFFAPFAMLPYGVASLLWKLLTIALYGGCCYVLWRACPGLHRRSWTVLAVLALAYPAFSWVTLFGQTSVLVLLLFLLIYFALPHRPFLAGLAIGLLAYKPQYGVVAACVFVFTAQWRVVAGAIASIATQCAAVAAILGTRVFADFARSFQQQLAPQYQMDGDWVHALQGFGYFALPWNFCPVASVRGFFQIVIPAHDTVPYLLSALLLTAVTVIVWRYSAPLKLRFALLLLTTVLVSPHAFAYDLVIVLPAIAFTEEWSLGHSGAFRNTLRLLLYATYVLPALPTASTLLIAAMVGFSLLLAYGAIRASHAAEPSMSQELVGVG